MLPTLHTYIEKTLNPATKTTPVFMAHGKQDPVVLYEYGKASADFIKNLGYQVEWHEYNMEHSVCPDETHDLGQWISSRLGLQT